MKKLIFIIIILDIGLFANGQNCSDIDTDLVIKKSKNIIIKTNKNLYANPPELNIFWDSFEIKCGTSIDCDNVNFNFILISFIDSEGHFADVIYKNKSKNRIKFIDCHFTIDKPEKTYKELIDSNNYWICHF